MAGRIAYYGNIVKDGLVLCLDAAKRDSYPGSGTVWRDISGFGNNGTLTNGPTFNSGNYGSISFDGSNDYVSVPTIKATPAFSMECFFNSQDNNFKTLLNCNTLSPRLSIRNNVINLYYQTTGGTGDILFTFSSISTNIYNHMVLTYDPVNNHTCFLNGITGVRTSNNTAITAIPSYTNINIGQTYGSDSYFIGNIGVVRIYNRALSAQEILQNYNATKGRYGL